MFRYDAIDVRATHRRSGGALHPFRFGVQLRREGVQHVGILLSPVFVETKGQRDAKE